MGEYMKGMRIWLDAFPLEKEVEGWKSMRGDDVLLVDVGGNLGPMIEGLKTKVFKANIVGRHILQELPQRSNLRSG